MIVRNSETIMLIEIIGVVFKRLNNLCPVILDIGQRRSLIRNRQNPNWTCSVFIKRIKIKGGRRKVLLAISNWLISNERKVKVQNVQVFCKRSLSTPHGISSPLSNFQKKRIRQTKPGFKRNNDPKKKRLLNMMNLDNRMFSSKSPNLNNNKYEKTSRLDTTSISKIRNINNNSQIKRRTKESQQVEMQQRQQQQQQLIECQKESENDTENCDETKVIQNKFNLSQKEFESFGDRFPDKFYKVKLLGRGGFSLVWLGAHRKTRELFAIKQILTKNSHQSHLKEIWFGNFFFEPGGQPRQELSLHPGINNLVRMISYDIKHLDTWIFYELCDQTLGSALYELKSEPISKTQKIYKIYYHPFYVQFQKSNTHLKRLIIEISKSLCLLAEHNIIHSDIKTENILVRRNADNQMDYKLIDYGSSFLFSNLKQFSMATPEYMAPEILNFILYQNELPYDQEMLKIIKNYKNESAIDIWSFGCVVLEIICGLPLWMSINTEFNWNKDIKPQCGLFAIKGRLFDKIIEMQIDTINNLDYILQHNNNSGIKLDADLMYLMKRMLDLDPEKRIKPKQILQFFNIPYEYDKNYFAQ